ncbi:MAG: VOC family protein [Alphaproteobacteria bacterium]|nr:VOC family protein [Alphaproteobacteria bacterium]
MKITARDIDHVVLTSTAPETLARRLGELGFTLTPEGTEPRCICFQPAADDVPNFIALREGEDAAALALNVAKLDGPVETFSWETEDGPSLDAELVSGDPAAALGWRPVQHPTPDAFTAPEWIVHPNGALAMMAVHAVADDPAALAKTLKAAWGGKSETIFDGCSVVKTGTVELLIWTPAAWQDEYKAIEAMAPATRPAIVGLAIAVERARPVRALLNANNIPNVPVEDGRILVGAEAAGGLAVEFVPQV